MVKIHGFEDSGEAYDAVNWDDRIKDGDLLLTRDGHAAIAVSAWPTNVVPTSADNAFHTLNPELTWATFEGGKYLPAFELYKEIS